MKERSFTLKSYRKGLALHIDKEAEMNTLLEELREKFQSSRQFFGNMQVGLSLSGKDLTPEEEKAILDVIEDSSDLRIVCLIGKDDTIQHLLDKALDPDKAAGEETGLEGQFYRGTLKKGQSLDTEHSVIILGDVGAGAKVFSRKDIIVLGALSGEAHAGVGADDEDGHFICALEFSPEKLKIGSYKYRKKPEKRLWPDSYKKLPKMAVLQGGEIIVKPVTKELLGRITLENNDLSGQ